MAPFNGRTRRSGRGNFGGRGRGSAGKLARSGIRTKHGYKKFDSQRVKDLDDSENERSSESHEPEPDPEDSSGDEAHGEDAPSGLKSYNLLLQSFHYPHGDAGRKPKRRKIVVQEAPSPIEPQEETHVSLESEENDDGEVNEEEEDNEDTDVHLEDDRVPDAQDPFELHFANPHADDLSRRLRAAKDEDWRKFEESVGNRAKITISEPSIDGAKAIRLGHAKTVTDLHLKERLRKAMSSRTTTLLAAEMQQVIASCIFEYQDLLLGNRTPHNAASLRSLLGLHVVNHVLKGRDKVLKNNERLKHAEESVEIDARDQGFVRPKVLILTETRQMAGNYANAVVAAFSPEQQENRKRFDDSFTAPLNESGTMPADFQELFEGNNDNSFRTALKLTRKTLKFNSAFYNSDIILASPLGLRQIIENEDSKKRDYDFLSSIEIVIVDQADAMQMQNWENVDVVLEHLNLELRETHGCDFSRVRSWYLDGDARYLRQTIMLSAYVTPEMNRVYNRNMLNVAGRARLAPLYAGALVETSGLDVKQTLSRFETASPLGDPDARFKYFTTAILPGLLRLPKPTDGASGILVFIPSYFDFLRVRNFFAASTQTANISFGTIHDYSEVSEQRRARSHFTNGRHSFLLYTQRAHHFFRLRLRGVKRVVMYGLPDNPIFYHEIVHGFLGTTIDEGKIDPSETSIRSIFSKWDGLRLERIVGSERVKRMLGGVGDTFDFVY